MSLPAYETLKQSATIGRVRLSPSAISLHHQGPAAHDDLWLPVKDADGAVQLQNCSTGHVLRLNPSDVASVALEEAAPRDGLVHLRVALRRRLWLRGRQAGWLKRPARSCWFS